MTNKKSNVLQFNGLFKQSKLHLCSLAVQEREFDQTTAYIIFQQYVMSMMLGFVTGYLGLAALEVELGEPIQL